MAALLFLGACSDDPPERSIADILSEIEGTPLTPAEVANLVQTADLMCGLNSNVLKELLVQVGPDRLDFTDWVFTQHCGSREALYREVLPQRLAEQVEQSDG